MAEERSILLSVEIDTDKLNKASREAAARVDELKVKQKELKEAGQQNTVEYAKLSNELRSFNKVLKDNSSAIEINERLSKKSNLTRAEERELNKAGKIALAGLTDEEVRSTEAGKKLEKQVKDLNESIKDQGARLGDNQGFVGQYTRALEGIPGATGAAAKGVSGLSSTLKALLSNPVVLIISGIVGAFALLKKAFTSSAEGSEKLNKVTTFLSGVFSSLLKVLKPIANFLFDGIGKAFTFVTGAIDKAISGISAALDFFGFDGAAKSLNNFTNEAKNLKKATDNIAKSESELIKLRREQRKIQLQGQFDAEKLRQLRDDESRSIKDRIKSNQELNKVLQKQLNDELFIAEKELNLVKQKIALEGASNELLDKKAEAELQIIDINERIIGQQSEQLMNINSLRRDEEAARKERVEKQKKYAEDQKKLMEKLVDVQLENEEKTTELQLKIVEQKYIALQNSAQNNTDELIRLEGLKNEELIAIEQQQRDNTIKRLQEDFKRESSEYKKGSKIRTELEKQLQIDIDTINQEYVSNAINRNAEYVNKVTDFQNQRVQNEQKAADEIALINAELNLLNSKGLEGEQEAFKNYQNERIRILLENAEREIELNKLVGKEAQAIRDKAKLEVKKIEDEKLEIKEKANEKELTKEELKLQKQTTLALNSANQLSGALSQFVQSRITNELNEEKDKNDQKLQLLKNQLDAGIISESEYNVKKSELDAAYNEKTAKIKEDQFKKKKRADTIQSIINTAVGVTQAIPNLPLMAVAGAIGALQTAAIVNQPTPKFEKGGIFGGKSHSQGGTKGYFDDGTKIEVEKDEAFFILNKRATPFLSQLSALNTSTGGVPLFASGGKVSFEGAEAFRSTQGSAFNDTYISNIVTSTVRSLPKTVVLVEDIISAVNVKSQVVSRASF